jgi:hypothetical protein
MMLIKTKFLYLDFTSFDAIKCIFVNPNPKSELKSIWIETTPYFTKKQLFAIFCNFKEIKWQKFAHKVPLSNKFSTGV